MIYAIYEGRPWAHGMARKLAERTGKQFANCGLGREIYNHNPRYFFLPFCSEIVPSEIYDNFEVVIFHMTDLPFGRGGTPLQNLITRGLTKTKISAIRCTKEIDGGPVYLKRDLTLEGTAEEIYLRAANIIAEMIEYIVTNEPTPQPQTGEPTLFVRRTPEQSNISSITSLERLFDSIRMVDAEGYPRAHIEAGAFRFDFSRASLKSNSIVADVTITRRDEP